ncbi:MAG: hypothetical protein LQ338_004499 [Usnochroma carphineum]|nr:MAG: hypothetical protein LQ338_004499 [Usnochroma carphineum]
MTMASTLMYRPPTSGTTGSSHSALDRQASLSSFPSSRTPSNPSMRNGVPTSTPPQPGRGGSSSSSMAPSTPSSTKRVKQQSETMRRAGKLKSQYPADSTERHVEYILVASFHVDRGPVMEHQYPGAISGDENMLAELMLPDQAHVRKQDWTIFFLHKDTSEEDEKEEGSEGNTKEGKTSGGNIDAAEAQAEKEKIARTDMPKDQEEVEGGEGPPLIYVLNLVNTKQDTTAKRGAVVKAMAICTRHSFLHIYKPLLLLALQEYFRMPFPETLAALYDAVNAMDLSLMPRLTVLERAILQASDTKDLFIEIFERMIQQRMAEDAKLNTLTSPESPEKSTTEPQRRYNTPRDTHEFESKVIYNQIPIPIKVPTSTSAETVGDFSLIKLIQAFSTPHASSPQPFILHPHLTTSGAYTHPVIVLVNAILTQKRVIFLGHNRPSGEIAEAVLAACALASGGILRGFTRHAFPYTDLTKIDDLLNVPGFIAGVTNPAFANHPEWWDLLCDVPTGRMKISNKLNSAPITDGLVYFQQQNPGYAPSPSGGGGGGGALSLSASADGTGDSAFMDDLLRSISSRHGESVIRSKWRDYIIKFTRIAAAFEESVYGASALFVGAAEADAGAHGVRGHGYVWAEEAARARELGANVWRIEGWRNTRSYYAFIQDLAAVWERRPIRSIDLAHQHDRLRCLRLSHEDSAAIYLALSASVKTYDEICQLLTVTPESNAGLFYISLGLLHPDPKVRLATVGLLEKIMGHEAGRHFWARLSRFSKLAFVRVKRELGGAPKVGDGADSSPVENGDGNENGLDARVRAVAKAG